MSSKKPAHGGADSPSTSKRKPQKQAAKAKPEPKPKAAAAPKQAEAKSKGPSWLQVRVVDPVVSAFDSIGTTLLLGTETTLWAFRRPFRARRIIREMEFLGVESIFLISLTAMFSGAVLALQMVTALKQFNQQGVVGGIVAKSLASEISPVFTGLMVTARAGSAIAAELGNMRVTEQIDAITTMGVSPVQYLLSPRLVAAVLMTPLLCILYTCVGMFGGYLVAVPLLGIDPGIFLQKIKLLATSRDLFMGLVKAAAFGVLISVISSRHGYYASGGARGVGEATTRAVVQSAVAILVANYIITSWMTEL